jgi:hypothetical protein
MLSIPFQRRDAPQRLLLPCEIPILNQLLTMRRCPLHYEAERAWRQVAFQNGRRLNRHDRALLRVSHVEVWRSYTRP